MRLSETAQYRGATPHQVFDLLCDEEFRGLVCERIGALAHTVTVERDGDGATVQISRTMAVDMPDFIKKMSGAEVEITQTERWHPATDGERTGSVQVTIANQPASMSGTATVRHVEGGATLSLEGEVNVRIPFIGSRLEPQIAEAIAGAIRAEAAEGTAYLHR